MYTLGIATMTNSAACIFEGGRLVCAIENERLTRVKNDDSFPLEAIRECLKIAEIKFSDIAEVAVYWQPWRLSTRALGTLKKFASSSFSRRHINSRLKEIFEARRTDVARHTSSWLDLFLIRRILTDAFGKSKFDVSYFDHHLTHQVYAEAMRDWDDYASLSYDGGGEDASSVLSVVQGGARKTISVHNWPNSLGHMYSTFTGFLGFKMLEGEYKMMGLAPYGEPVYLDLILSKILRLSDSGRYDLNTSLCDYHAALNHKFHPTLIDLFGLPRRPDEVPTKAHVDLAASAQRAFEIAQQHVLSPLKIQYPEIRKLVVSGGCALNVTANGKLLQESLFDEIIIPPAPHDAGCAIGAAIVSLREKGISIDSSSVRSPYLGTEYEVSEIECVVSKYCKDIVRKLEPAELIEQTAALLADGCIIGWFQGKSEFGPRALGCRSFLADPRRADIQEEVNRKIKKRELFRPFAPSVTAEDAGRYFELEQQSPYMNIVAKVRDEFAEMIPAVTHIDQTARVHTVSKDVNPAYHALLTKFKSLTGIPVLLNTSFNIQEPIVQSPQDAMNTFCNSNVDALAIGPYLVRRTDLI